MDNKNILCPVCGKYYFPEEEDYEECPICNWAHDIWQEEKPDARHCMNIMSLNQAREAWKKGQEIY